MSPNTQYAFQVAARRHAALSEKTTDNCTTWTLAAVPAAPQAGNPSGTTFDAAIGSGNGNPASTEYAIHVTLVAGDDEWAQADGAGQSTVLGPETTIETAKMSAAGQWRAYE